MSADPLPDSIQISSSDQEPLSPLEKSRMKKFDTTDYRSEYAQACLDLLSNSDSCKNKSHVCAYLQCSKPTLLIWMRKYPEFHKAITEGLEIGKSKWYSRIAEHAFNPTAQVNNGLIKLLSANVYGIRDDSEAPIVTVNNIQQDPETIMKRKGIPIPDIDIDDVE